MYPFFSQKRSFFSGFSIVISLNQGVQEKDRLIWAAYKLFKEGKFVYELQGIFVIFFLVLMCFLKWKK